MPRVERLQKYPVNSVVTFGSRYRQKQWRRDGDHDTVCHLQKSRVLTSLNFRRSSIFSDLLCRFRHIVSHRRRSTFRHLFLRFLFLLNFSSAFFFAVVAESWALFPAKILRRIPTRNYFENTLRNCLRNRVETFTAHCDPVCLGEYELHDGFEKHRA